MEHARFWAVIAGARGSAEALRRALAELPRPQIAAFDAWFWAYHLAIHREDLWAVVFAIRGGCSDDSFDYFCAWLIGRGEAALLAAIRDPESLVELIGDTDPRDQSLLGAASDTYGRELPASPMPAIPGKDGWPADRIQRGAKWDAAFYAEHFPTLVRYCADERAPPSGEISHDRFWTILDSATAGADVVRDARARLSAALRALPQDELVGFHRWLYAYNRALSRTDLRWAATITLGRNDIDTDAGFRGWLLLQGREVVNVATHEADAIVERARLPLEPCMSALFATWQPLEERGIYHKRFEDTPAIPDVTSWTPDIVEPTVAELRARFPRLTANVGDDRLRAQQRAAVSQAPRPKRIRRAKLGEHTVVATDTTRKRVRHAKFGEGTVVSLVTTTSEPKLVIDFLSGRKTIASRFVEMIDDDTAKR